MVTLQPKLAARHHVTRLPQCGGKLGSGVQQCLIAGVHLLLGAAMRQRLLALLQGAESVQYR
ncbi:hypothetical protein ABB30_03650 [Stenotrophomonas ginsengisoli]|uniref:Uncharacterized protein n=1 Tax=Stenotrophomonas ginsengisoli TaxID=336566 RepID=A0A0R0DKA6_9GAMM|nr:hypothetical protein ABB30_03650 [Stenotrophomonas ginsengisoli]